MIELTDQKIFDNALFGLRKQGKACVSPDSLRGEVCLYADGKGGHCAVGFSIDREHYDPNIEGEPLEDLLEDGEYPMFKKGFHDLLYALQSAHDTTLKKRGLSKWEEEMEVISREYELTYTEAEK